MQLHATQDSQLTARLREHFGSPIKILRVLHYAQDLETQLRALQWDESVNAVLIDSRTATAVGGTGTTFDWQAARESFLNPASPLRLIAAGGLNPGNVREAIRVLRPWGVDVVSGVEAAPGKKDPERVRNFIRTARAAAEEIAAETPR